MKKRVALVSLGCAKNLVDSEEMLAMFPSDRFELSSRPEGADLILVNTCGFINSAKKESIETILQMASLKKGGAKLVVTGCLAERYADELRKEIPEANLVVPLKDYPNLSNMLMGLLGEAEISPMNPLNRLLSTASYSAYLRISDGCNNFCSFCAIPFIRGRFKSRPYEEVLAEARKLKGMGVKEISLISQDTTIYGTDLEKGHDIVALLKDLEKIGFYSIRLLYLYPSEISDELIETIAQSKVIAHYFDIPVQCASDHLLSLMKRHADQKETVELFRKIRRMCPDAILRTTLISGFPGENEEDQKETIEFLKEIAFDKMGCFLYSREEGTASYNYPDQIKEATKKKRRAELMKLQAGISFEKNKGHVGETMEGIVIGKEKNGNRYLLRSYWNAPDDIDGSILFTSSAPVKEGDIVKVKIKEALVYDLIGEMD